MHLVFYPPFSVLGAELVRRLLEQGIPAAVVQFLGDGSMGRQEVTILEPGDLERARRIQRDLESEQRDDVCPKCSFDLRGHHGASRCPECGTAIQGASEEYECPSCQEPVPAHFERCWSCRRALPDDGAPA